MISLCEDLILERIITSQQEDFFADFYRQYKFFLKSVTKAGDVFHFIFRRILLQKEINQKNLEEGV